MSDWTLNQIEDDFADLHGGVYDTDIIEERRAAFREVLNEAMAEAFDEGMYALGDTIGIDPEWYDRILRPSEEYQ